MLLFATQLRLPLIDAQWHQLRLKMVGLSLLAGVQDDAVLADAYPDPQVVLRAAEYMKQRRLSIFAGNHTHNWAHRWTPRIPSDPSRRVFRLCFLDAASSVRDLAAVFVSRATRGMTTGRGPRGTLSPCRTAVSQDSARTLLSLSLPRAPDRIPIHRNFGWVTFVHNNRFRQDPAVRRDKKRQPPVHLRKYRRSRVLSGLRHIFPTIFCRRNGPIGFRFTYDRMIRTRKAVGWRACAGHVFAPALPPARFFARAKFTRGHFMQRLTFMACLLLLAGMTIQAQTTTPGSSPAAGQPKPLVSFDLNAIDKSVDPCNDFYQFACGTWMKQNPIPADQAAWGRFNELHQNNQIMLRNILDKKSADNAARSPNDQKIGDYYYSCMDEAGIEAKGTKPLQPMLDRIAALKDKSELPALIGQMHSARRKRAVRLRLRARRQGFEDGDRRHRPGWFGPARPRLLPEGRRQVGARLRQQYQQHVANMFKLVGDSPDKAAAEAKTVMQVETALAKASLDRVERRDPNKVYHKMTKDAASGAEPRLQVE